MNKAKAFFLALSKVKNWPTYVLDYLKLKDGKVVYRLYDGSCYVIRGKSNDRNIFNEILVHRLYNPEGFEIKKGDIVFDVGAHIGIFSLFTSENASKVYSFEPFKENFEMLRHNVKVNKSYNITAVNKGISSSAGKRDLFISKDNLGGHSFYVDKELREKVTIETISLKEVVLQHHLTTIDFLKMDCEGAEYDILFTCPEDILKRIKKISMEYHNINDEYNVEKLKDFLLKNGFTVRVVTELDMLYASRS